MEGTTGLWAKMLTTWTKTEIKEEGRKKGYSRARRRIQNMGRHYPNDPQILTHVRAYWISYHVNIFSSHFLICQSLSESQPTNSDNPLATLKCSHGWTSWTCVDFFKSKQWCRSGCHSVKKSPHESTLFRHESNTKLAILHSLIHLNADIRQSLSES